MVHYLSLFIYYGYLFFLPIRHKTLDKNLCSFSRHFGILQNSNVSLIELWNIQMCKGVYNALRCNGVCIRNAIRLDLCNIGTKIEGELSQQDIIGDVLRNLVPFGQFKKRKKHKHVQECYF